jgi:radical S-adenosyl methionine domain-containing protein 2
VEGKNDSDRTLRDARHLLITKEEFNAFYDRHKHQKCLVPESNDLMANSYLILDEYLRFLDRTGRKPSKSIVDVGVRHALDSVFWNEKVFVERGGEYEWGKY